MNSDLTIEELNKAIAPFLDDPYLKWRAIECSPYTVKLFRQVFTEVDDKPDLIGGIEIHTDVNMLDNCARLLDGKGNTIGYWVLGFDIIWRS